MGHVCVSVCGAGRRQSCGRVNGRDAHVLRAAQRLVRDQPPRRRGVAGRRSKQMLGLGTYPTYAKTTSWCLDDDRLVHRKSATSSQQDKPFLSWRTSTDPA
eukprot:3360646-Rhodomonas_salina.2